MGLFQDVPCITEIKHNYGDVHGGMKRCWNCGNVEETEQWPAEQSVRDSRPR